MNRCFFLCLGLSLVVLAMTACKVTHTGAGITLPNHYQNDVPRVIKSTSIRHLNDKSVLSVVIDLEQLTAVVPVASSNGSEHLDFIVGFKLQSNITGGAVIDSARVVVKELEKSGRTSYTTTFEVEVLSDRKQVAMTFVHDMNGQQTHRDYLTVFPPNVFSAQQLLVLDEEGKEPEGQWLRDQRPHFITGVDAPLFLQFYGESHPPAAPPFAPVYPKPMPDVPRYTKVLQAVPTGVMQFAPSEHGIYLLKRDTNSQASAAYVFYGEHFPNAKSHSDMLEPLRYITTTPEFQDMMQGENIKRNIDNYWLKLAGNPNRAKTLIKEFYTRVAFSNAQFTSYLEGWKSDRGMCYIVFGAPTSVTKSTASETWIYGDPDRYNSLKLTFVKLKNPFTEEDFRLQRSADLKSPWYRAVEFWRQGRIINYN